MGKVINGDSYIDREQYNDYKALQMALTNTEQYLNRINNTLKNISEKITIIENMLNKQDNKNSNISFNKRMFLLKIREQTLNLRLITLREQDEYLKQKNNIIVSLTITEYDYSIAEISRVIFKFLNEFNLSIVSSNNIKESREIQNKYTDIIIFLKKYIEKFESTMTLFENDLDIADDFKNMIQQERDAIQDLYLKVMACRSIDYGYPNPTYRKFLKN